jgi:hypothetical protein
MFLCSVIAAVSPTVPSDPVGDYDFPDPAAVFHDGVYYAFGGPHMMSSADLASWSERRDFLQRSPAWAVPGSRGGAPGAPIKTAEGFLMTFQAEQRGCTRSVCTCIGAGLGLHPGQPFEPNAEPITCMASLDGAIDSSPRRLKDGSLAVYFKTTGFNTAERPSSLWAVRISEGGAMLSEPALLLNASEAWETRDGIGCIEGPALLELVDGTSRLFYSGGDWTAGLDGLPYSIGYADCVTPFGPCKKMTRDRPWFGPAYNDTVGVGGQEVFSDNDGQVWMVYHGWRRGHAGYARGGRRAVRFHPLKAMPPFVDNHAYKLSSH